MLMSVKMMNEQLVMSQARYISHSEQSKLVRLQIYQKTNRSLSTVALVVVAHLHLLNSNHKDLQILSMEEEWMISKMYK